MPSGGLQLLRIAVMRAKEGRSAVSLSRCVFVR